jgi:hypothetical protein
MTAEDVAFSNAITALLRVALDVLACDLSPDEHDGQHAVDRLALAARDLTRATDALAEDEQPSGWRPAIASECCDGSGLADYAAVPCPNPKCPVLAASGAIA